MSTDGEEALIFELVNKSGEALPKYVIRDTRF